MRYLFISLLILLSLTGCEDKAQQAKHDAQVAQQAKAELLAELEAKKLQAALQTERLKEENTKLNKMGIAVDNGTITIDTNKTKDFFNDLGAKMDIQMKKISADLEKGILETKEAGLEINEQHIHIDLNKTNELLLDWGKKIQVFVQDFDEASKIIETNSTNTTNKGI